MKNEELVKDVHGRTIGTSGRRPRHGINTQDDIEILQVFDFQST
jgi:hypothetical protein